MACEPQCDPHADRIRRATEHTRIAVALLGASLAASYLVGVSPWFRPAAVALLVAGLTFALTAWPSRPATEEGAHDGSAPERD